MSKRRWLLVGGIGASLVIVLALVGGVLFVNARRSPDVYLSPQFLWAKDAQTIQHMMIPVKPDDPRAVVSITAQRERGFGPFLTGGDLFRAADADARQTLATITSHMQSLGWKALYAPARTDSYPDYGLYVTFQSGQHYCFVEYSAAELDQPEADRYLDMWWN